MIPTTIALLSAGSFFWTELNILLLKVAQTVLVVFAFLLLLGWLKWQT